MKITKTRLVKLVKEELNAVLQEEDWMAKAFDPKKKGDLHRAMGVPEDENIPVGRLRKKAAALSKDAEGDKTLSPKDLKLSRQINLALTARDVTKEGCGDISEDNLGDPQDVITIQDPGEEIDEIGEGMDDEMHDVSLAALADMLLPKLMKLLGKDEEAAEDDEG